VKAWQSEVLERLNPKRDPWVLLALAEAGVLVTSQVCRLHFTGRQGPQACRRRLRKLRALRLVVGFRPSAARDAELHWALTDRGAEILAVLLGETVRAGAWAKGEASARALPHRLATTEFFMALVGGLVPVRAGGAYTIRAAKADEPSSLWLGERGCRTVFGDPSRRPLGMRVAVVPDGAALIAAGDRSVPVVLELDRGTESTHVLAEKLSRYARVGGIGAVVVCFTDPVRAAWRVPDIDVPVLVGDLASHVADPWGPVWTADAVRQPVALGDVLSHRACLEGGRMC